MERWLKIPGYDNYEVSDLGRVYSYGFFTNSRYGVRWVKERILKPILHANGYLVVCLTYAPKRQRTELIHLLVLRTFCGEPQAGQECRHLDGVKSNIALSNLVWGTRQQNADDRKRHGTVARGARNGKYTKPEKTPRGAANGASKLTVGAVRYIRKLLECGFTMQGAADEFNVSKSTVFDIKRRHIWAHI